jgi:hypothetical protein
MVKLLWRPIQFETEELVMVILWPEDITLMKVTLMVQIKASLLLASVHVVPLRWVLLK